MFPEKQASHHLEIKGLNFSNETLFTPRDAFLPSTLSDLVAYLMLSTYISPRPLPLQPVAPGLDLPVRTRRFDSSNHSLLKCRRKVHHQAVGCAALMTLLYSNQTRSLLGH
jgi:hypothetical protein